MDDKLAPKDFPVSGITVSILVMITVMHRVNKKINSPDKNYNIVPIPGKF